jgi:hypothetical protein
MIRKRYMLVKMAVYLFYNFAPLGVSSRILDMIRRDEAI